jgi:hypothetical protein
MKSFNAVIKAGRPLELKLLFAFSRKPKVSILNKHESVSMLTLTQMLTGIKYKHNNHILFMVKEVVSPCLFHIFSFSEETLSHSLKKKKK